MAFRSQRTPTKSSARARLLAFVTAGLLAPPFAAAQVRDGTYPGTLSCEALIGNPADGEFSAPVQLVVANGLATYIRNGRDFTERGEGRIVDGQLNVDASIRYVENATRSSVWRLVGPLRLDGQNLSGKLAITSLDQSRLYRNCIAKIAVQTGPSPTASVAASRPLDVDTREEITKVPMVVKNFFGKEIKGDITLTTFRPNGTGPFPLVVIGHGRPGFELDLRSKVERQRYESAARFFVRKGFAVAVPTRLGYGETAAAGDPEDQIDCARAEYTAALDTAGYQTLAIVAYMRTQPYVDPGKLVLIGQSLGGSASIAATSKHPSGLVATLNFAGGHGGRRNNPGEPCAPYLMTRSFGNYGQESAKGPAVPTLWVYTENDALFNPRYTKAWADAYIKGGGTAEYMLLPPVGQNGHTMFYTSADLWEPIVDKFLARFGFTVPGVIPRPAATNFAKLEDSSALPYIAGLKAARDNYAKFLALPKPRAFAVGSLRYHGYSSGDDAMSRAFSACQRETGAPCKLYAVDDDVVWQN